jgi:hypothetical protein
MPCTMTQQKHACAWDITRWMLKLKGSKSFKRFRSEALVGPEQTGSWATAASSENSSKSQRRRLMPCYLYKTCSHVHTLPLPRCAPA